MIPPSVGRGQGVGPEDDHCGETRYDECHIGGCPGPEKGEQVRIKKEGKMPQIEVSENCLRELELIAAHLSFDNENSLPKTPEDVIGWMMGYVAGCRKTSDPGFYRIVFPMSPEE